MPRFPEALNNSLLVHGNCLWESFSYFGSVWLATRLMALGAFTSDAMEMLKDDSTYFYE